MTGEMALVGDRFENHSKLAGYGFRFVALILGTPDNPSENDKLLRDGESDADRAKLKVSRVSDKRLSDKRMALNSDNAG